MTASPGVQAPRHARAVSRLHLLWPFAACLLPAAAVGQSFDCAKASDPVDRAICASPRLRQLDSELATAYAAALKRDPAQTDLIRQAQRSWASGRSACVAPVRGSGRNTPAEQCLATAYATRLAALAPPAATATEAPRAPARATTSPTAAGPAAASPATSPASTASSAAAAVFATPRPAAGLPSSPTAAGTLERDKFPTAGETDVLLHVTSPGRFAIRAGSPTGTALQLVDMLTGPGERQGFPGKQDGRIDALLDTGTYKLRAFGDKGATGDTTLTLSGFSAAGTALLAPGYQPLATTLGDLQVRDFWFAVPDGAGPVRIEAAGRSLARLALWRDGRDLVDLPAATNLVSATPAHPMTDIVLSGPLPPGTYRLTAYGGPKLSWTDGATEEPLYVRTGRSDALLSGGASGSVGVFGSEAFDVPAGAARAMAILPQPADTALTATATGVDPIVLDSSKEDRAREGLLTLPARSARDRTLTFRAAPGQGFVLRTLAPGQMLDSPGLNPVSVDRTGRYLLSVESPAAGGDEAPAAAMLVRFHLNGNGAREGAAQVLASPGVPAIGPGSAWRARFNLRGDTTLLFRVTAPVTVGVHADGPPLTARVTTPEGAVMNAQGGGAVASSWALSPGWYVLVLTPKPGAVGLLDLTLGPRGVTPPQPEPAGPDAPDLSLGEQTIDAQSQLAVLANRVPDTASVLSARALPVEIADSPLVETLQAGQSATREVHTRLAGTLTLRDVASPEPLETRPVAAGATVQVALPAADHPRTLAVALLPAAATATPAPAPAVSLPVLQAGTPAFLDLKRDEQASFALTVAQGGLYQVQTTGRLKTAGRIGTAFIPDLGEANANGVGNNMLLQRYLRAGLYHLDVTAHDSAGRLGIVAASTPLPEGATLLPGGSVRATLMPGSGVAFPIHIETEGRYHLDLLGDGRTLSARLEDADGWPLRAAGDLTSIDQDLSPGRYRLIVQPASVDVRVVARLRRIETPVALTGHGPHPLPFEATQALQWREPAARGDPRDPDVWTFSLAGPAKVTLTLTGDGMTAALQADPPSAAPLARFVAGQPLAIDLPAGQYRVLASALGRNDRLDYTIRLHSDQLQPGVPRLVTLPADLPFAIAAPRVVNLTSFGRTPLRAELRDAAGTVLARTAGRTDDWSIAVSRQLAAGSYHLVLSTLAPPAGGQATQDGDNTQAADQDTGDSSGMAGDSGDDQGSSQDASDQSAGQGGQDADQNADQGGSGQGADQSTPSDSDQDQSAGPPPARTEITLSLPQDQPDTALPAAGTLRLPGTGVQHVTLPTAPAGGLLVAAAEAPVEIILALEQRDAGGTWRTIGQSQGLAPVIGVPVPEGTIPQGTIPQGTIPQGTISEGTIAWRASAWTVDGGTVPIQFAARAVSAPPAPVGTVALTKVPLDGITQPWFAASVADPGALMLHASAPDAALLASSAPDQPAEPPPNATIAAQSERVWLLAPHQGAVRLSAVQTAPGAPLGVAVPAGGHAILPAASGPCAYVASSGLGQPGIDAGRGFGVASSDTSSGVSGGAFALCGGKTVTAWNAGGGDPLRLALRTIPLAARPEAPVDQAYAGLVPPHAILKLRLPAGAKRIDVSLAAGTALVTPAADPVTVWSGGAALSRSLTGSWTTAELVNTTDAPTPAAVTVLPVEAPWTLAAGQVFRRFFGAAGSFSLPVAAQAGQRLMVAGDATAIVQQADGRVRQGAAIALDGPGRADVRHGTGAVALWIEGPGVSPWPATTPRDVSLPQRVTLEGQAMALRLSPPAPVLLRLSSSAPVILALGEEAPVLFGQGAAFARYLPAGAATLRLLAPQDGPLSGSLDLSATPVTNVAEGLGAPVAIPPGGAAVFGFTVTAGGPVGLGVRADPDRVAARLLDEHGTVLETGVSMLRTLAPGHYLLEASVPPDAPTVLARPAVLGIAPHPNPPPPDVIRGLLLAAGLTPPDSAR